MASNQVNVNLVRSIVEQIVREDGTPEEQATKALFLIREVKDKILTMEPDGPSLPSAPMDKYDFAPAGIRESLKEYEESELSRLQEENTTLRFEIALLNLRLIKAHARYNDLRKEVTGPTVMSASSETYAFAEFKRMMLEKHFFGRNKEQGWQQLFLDCNNLGYTHGHLNKWKAADVVPFEAIAEIDKLDLTKKVGEKMERWKPEEIEAFEEYVVVANGRFKLSKTHPQIAKELSIRFGRNLNENSIKSKMNTYKQNKKKKVVSAN